MKKTEFTPERLIPACAGKTCCISEAESSAAAHPRVCGENSSVGDSEHLGSGSSPRVRGKPSGPVADCGRSGLIPARAGKITSRLGRSCSRRAHPRACGENQVGVRMNFTERGSSPRVRGKCGLTGGESAGATAHPRACGENTTPSTTRFLCLGSSPRVRGKFGRGLLLEVRDRLIPARAGKIAPPGRRRAPRPAHPRACGENGIAGVILAVAVGSSPRVRGKCQSRPPHPDAPGLIPARAGKIAPSAPTMRPGGAHPRACGENPSPEDWRLAVEGSSPRVRGKFAVGHVLANRAGLIPARAGKIARPCRWSSRPRAHPRACGENVVDDAPLTAAEGSSPRVRGKSGQHAGSSRGAGLIPARAGKIRSTPPAPPWAAAHPRACGENSPLVWRRTIHTGSSPRVRGK